MKFDEIKYFKVEHFYTQYTKSDPWKDVRIQCFRWTITTTIEGQMRWNWPSYWTTKHDKSAHKFLQSCLIFNERSTLRFSTLVDFEINLHKGLSKRGSGFNYFIKLVPLHWRFIAFLWSECWGKVVSRTLKVPFNEIKFSLKQFNLRSRLAKFTAWWTSYMAFLSNEHFYDVVNQLSENCPH